MFAEEFAKTGRLLLSVSLAAEPGPSNSWSRYAAANPQRRASAMRIIALIGVAKCPLLAVGRLR